jgi:hypothetical protein
MRPCPACRPLAGGRPTADRVYISAWPSAFLASTDPWPPSLLFLPFQFLSLSLFFSLSRLCQCVTGFLPTFLLSCVRAVLLVINCLLPCSSAVQLVRSLAVGRSESPYHGYLLRLGDRCASAPSRRCAVAVCGPPEPVVVLTADETRRPWGWAAGGGSLPPPTGRPVCSESP